MWWRLAKPLYAVCWSMRKHRRTKTKKRALELQKVWAAWYTRQGWDVTRFGNDAYQATSTTGERHVIVLHEYDPKTLERIWVYKPTPSREKVSDEETKVKTQRKASTPSWA